MGGCHSVRKFSSVDNLDCYGTYVDCVTNGRKPKNALGFLSASFAPNPPIVEEPSTPTPEVEDPRKTAATRTGDHDDASGVRTTAPVLTGDTGVEHLVDGEGQPPKKTNLASTKELDTSRFAEPLPPELLKKGISEGTWAIIQGRLRRSFSTSMSKKEFQAAVEEVNEQFFKVKMMLDRS